MGASSFFISCARSLARILFKGKPHLNIIQRKDFVLYLFIYLYLFVVVFLVPFWRELKEEKKTEEPNRNCQLCSVISFSPCHKLSDHIYLYQEFLILIVNFFFISLVVFLGSGLFILLYWKSIIWIAKGWKFICDKLLLNIVAKLKNVCDLKQLPTKQSFCSRTVRLICCCHLYIFLMCNFFFFGVILSSLTASRKQQRKPKKRILYSYLVIFFTTNKPFNIERHQLIYYPFVLLISVVVLFLFFYFADFLFIIYFCVWIILNNITFFFVCLLVSSFADCW